MNKIQSYFLAIIAVATISSCNKDDDTMTPTTVNNTVPEVYAKIYGASSITNDGKYITIKTDGVPDIKVRTIQSITLSMKHTAGQHLWVLHLYKILIG